MFQSKIVSQTTSNKIVSYLFKTVIYIIIKTPSLAFNKRLGVNWYEEKTLRSKKVPIGL